MNRGWIVRFVVIALSCIAAVYLLYPSYNFYFQTSEEGREDVDKWCAAQPTWMHCNKFNLGLDLQGGVHLVMTVKVEKAVEHRADRLADALRDGLKTQNLAFSRVDRPRNTAEIVVTLAPDTSVDAFDSYLRKDLPSLRIVRRAAPQFTLELDSKEADSVRDSAVEQAIKTIRNRADKLGVTEPTIAKRGNNKILIQLPGVKDPERAISVIGKTAQLEFKIVDSEASAVFDAVPASELPAGVEKREDNFEGPGGKPIRETYFVVPDAQREAVLTLLTPKIASDREILFGELNRAGVGNAQKTTTWRTYLLDARPGITGDYLTNAQVQQNPELPSDYYVSMDFDPRGAQIFEKLTDENARRKMAVVLDGKVNSAPVIEGKIAGGRARITLGGAGDSQSRFNEAKDLTTVLKAGALPAPVEIGERREVGKSLGQDAVRMGSTASIVGVLLVILFMAIYYKMGGLISDVALILNFVFLMAILALFNATLTLPGLAGTALTLGMAIDDNVIIFERMREELRLGKTPRAAIEAGYSKAFATIIDAHVTTIIAGIVLMQYGSGPVRGFAVTLLIGLACSLFTSVYCTRAVYDFITARWRLKSLNI